MGCCATVVLDACALEGPRRCVQGDLAVGRLLRVGGVGGGIMIGVRGLV